ncbi:MAG: hypothetical protein HY303_09345 [Candidatus Wallbacteria bacterium]|nr:hypothetical protein [Candidatus Wallbacteria bacterium]
MIQIDLHRKASKPVEPPPRKSGKPVSPLSQLWEVDLAAALLERKALRRSWLLMALARRKETGRLLSEVLEQMGIACRRYQAAVLAEHLHVRFVGVAEAEVDPAVAGEIAPEVLSATCALPVSLKGQCLTVAMAQPRNAAALEMLRQSTERTIEPVLGDPVEIRKALECLRTLQGTQTDRTRSRVE